MLLNIALGSAVLWALGFLSGVSMGGVFHTLLVLAVALVVIHWLQDRREKTQAASK
ncbi:MAG: lmo0937 family membrane protein [Opitutales bacterium]|nr:lmo0937 family membrane protein [Opitutales bacterium]